MSSSAERNKILYRQSNAYEFSCVLSMLCGDIYRLTWIRTVIDMTSIDRSK